jgi:hypothetical protein
MATMALPTDSSSGGVDSWAIGSGAPKRGLLSRQRLACRPVTRRARRSLVRTHAHHFGDRFTPVTRASAARDGQR